MLKNGKAPKRVEVEEISGGQMGALLAGVAIEMPRWGDPGTVKAMIANTKKMRPILRRLVVSEDKVVLAGEEALHAWHDGWPRFWRAFGYRYDHEALILPEYRDGFGWSVVTPERDQWPMSRLLHEVCQRIFPIYSFYNDQDLDGIISTAEPTGAHVVLTRDRVEADEEHKNKSAKTIEAENISTMPPRQRAVLEARYFMETGEHLDIVSVTICAGSRYADGFVPYAYWFDDGFLVSYVFPGHADDGWRVRETVS